MSQHLMAKTPGVKSGRKPGIKMGPPVAFVFSTVDKVKGQWGAKGPGKRESYYANALGELIRRKQGMSRGDPEPVLEFADQKARSQCVLRARKMGVSVLFATDADGKFFVRLDDEISLAGRIRGMLREMPLTLVEVVKQLNAGGSNISHDLAKQELQVLSQSGAVRLNNGKWELTAARAK